MLLTLYRLFRGPDIVDRVLALDTLAINLIALIVLSGFTTTRRYISKRRCCSRWSGFISTVSFCKFLLRGNVIE